ncbi:hypothetical protein CXZ10_01600 [Pleomorphomonas diazotrophica]|uniref:Protein phosphatase 2C domain-containing protein n=1 Tax=Pleomorphomonas diazotrophica TaxID=1166257 RepID=A0A1I4VGR6_9HYPH|nr:hypothetical protein [Pleomorphomonas diazotrophica]PKR90111.1 hypothetical protein CXZ10_01600 [Pleomorphomonas diazotrophica]SFN00444.1 hypothetical protein SAMN05192571_111133 [Pleomorphomonas diazotrophica]
MTATPRPFRVIESLCASGKDSDAKKEDWLVVTDDFAAVIDGATSSGPIGGRPGGIVAAEAVERAVRELAPDATARDFVDRATAAIAMAIGDWTDETIMRPSAVAAVWSRARGEVWRVGDCHVRIDRKDYPGGKEIDRIGYEFRCAVIRARLRLGMTSLDAELRVPTMEQPFRPLVLAQHAFLNLDSDDPLAYGGLAGTFVPDRFVEVFEAADAREIVLASDGFLSPPATLAEGLAEIARIRENDPLMVELVTGSRPFVPGRDYFDDTTYLRIAIG